MSNADLKKFAAKYYGLVTVHRVYYIRLDNLILNKTDTSFMDIKMGTRTFSESMADPKDPVRRRKKYFDPIKKQGPCALSYEEARGEKTKIRNYSSHDQCTKRYWKIAEHYVIRILVIYLGNYSGNLVGFS